MTWQFNWYPYHLLTLGLALISVLLFSYVFIHRHKTGAKYALAMLGLMFIWSIAQGLEFSVQSLEGKIFFANIQYLPITLIPALYFFLALCFSRRDQLLDKKAFLIAFMIVPVVLNLLIWSDGDHGLIRKTVYLNMGEPFPTVEKTFGPTLYPFALYNFSLTLFTLFTLFKTWRDKGDQYRTHAKYLFIGLLIPTITNLLHYLQIHVYNIDLTPLSFTLTSLFLSYGIVHHGMFDLMPVALSRIFSEMKAGIIVYDSFFRVIDVNPAAIEILGVTGQPVGRQQLIGEKMVGQQIGTLCSHLPEWVKVFENPSNQTVEVHNSDNQTLKVYEISIRSIENKVGIGIGWMAQIYDVTDRKILEEKLKSDKENALMLYESAEIASISNESAFLQAQIKPHFLYNALNVIAVLCKMDPDKARELILDLSNYMHHSFDFKNLEKYIDFDEELELIQSYVRIEQARFRDSLNVVYDIENVSDLRLPPLLLQPLVENAIRHGLRRTDQGRSVILRVRELESMYLIEVEDDGIGMTPEQLESITQGAGTGGVGLANIQKRLKMIYNTNLIIESQLNHGTKVTIKLPKKRDEEICALS